MSATKPVVPDPELVAVHLEVTVPEDWQTGKNLSFTHNGKRYEAPVPEGQGPGSTFRISLTDALSAEGNKAQKRRRKMVPMDKQRAVRMRKDGSRKKMSIVEKKQQRIQDDDAIMRDTLRKFFSGHGRGRTPEHIRRTMDAVLTILASNPEIDRRFLDRYLAFPAGRMTDRYAAAKRRADHNASLVGPQKAAQWKWFDPPAKRSDAYSAEMCAEAAAFWRSPPVSKPMLSKSTLLHKYRQMITLNAAHIAYIKHKQQSQPEFKCSFAWFREQRPKDVKKLVVRPTGVRKASAAAAEDEEEHYPY